MVLSCTNGVDSWTTTKNFCPDWFCRNATVLWAATYSEADGLQLSVTQSRTCGKEESCAAGGHDDNDDNDDHSVEPCVFFARAEAFPAPISFAAPSVASQGPLEGAKRQAANFQLKTRKFFIEGLSSRVFPHASFTGAQACRR